MKSFINEISKNKNLEVNLPMYANYMTDLYNQRAYVEFAMDYYTFQGMIADHVTKDEYLTEFTKEFNEVVKQYVLSLTVDESREEGIAKIDSLRNKVYNIVEVLTCYADIFSRYEYMVNRCQYLFDEMPVNAKYTDQDYTRQIMQYIFSDEDNAVVNMKICEIISELPFRMTKNKFFELLKAGMSVYKDSDKETIDDFLYNIETSALLKFPEDMEHYKDLYEIYTEIKAVDYANIDEETYRSTLDKLTYAADFIEKATNIFMILQGLINKAYAVILLAPYADSAVSEVENARRIVANINENFYDEDFVTLEESITDSFVFMEGIPEKLQNIIQSAEYVLDDVRNNHLKVVKNIMSDKIYLALFVTEQLLNDSLFINLDKQYQVFESQAEEETAEINVSDYLDKQYEKLEEELRVFFVEHNKQMNKAIMSLVLSKLPVFFNNVSEVQEYVYNALVNCTNKAEKAAAIEIINGLMEN